jgi:ankyrin repeat protein
MPERVDQEAFYHSAAELLQREDLAAELRDYARSNDEAGVRELLGESMWPDVAQRVALTNAAEERTGNTALHMASANGHVEIVQLLIECGANAAVQNAAGNTPIHWASMNGQLDCVQVLLQALQAQGASPFLLNHSGRSAYDEAVIAGFEQVAALLMRFAEEHPASTFADTPHGIESPNQSQEYP